MTASPTHIADLLLIEPNVFEDERGYFMESFKADWFAANIAPAHFVQDNESKSSRGVLRGLHFQTGDFAQAKLVRVLQGEVDNPYSKAHEGGILFNDPELDIDWGIPSTEMILSEKDTLLPSFEEWKALQST